jgi:MYXO-CTERM domain-containing protein
MLRTAAATAALVAASAAMAGGTTYFRLFDHPDGNANPPGYGLRFDNLFSDNGYGAGTGGVTTFSFVDVIMTVTDTGSSLEINISGELFGGEDDGSSYDFGEGSYELDFSYSVNVAADGTGYRVTDDSAANAGTLTALTGDAAGDVFTLRDYSVPSFLFLQDEHRLGGHSEAGEGFWVGRGWLADGDGNRNGTRDFLFLGEMLDGPPIIPLPMSGAMGLAGLAVVATRRRR